MPRTKRTKVVTPPKTHKVQEGDTIAQLATASGISVGRLKALNQLRLNQLRVGKTLTLR